MDTAKLSLFIITYNRSKLLRRTLDYIANSLLREYQIIILNNASTDDTKQVINEYVGRLPKLGIINNKANVGPNANFLKAFDYSDSEYTWILCDDDVFDLTKFNDVLASIEEGKADLLHVGAHKQEVWRMGGKYSTPRELLANKYAYFKFASFMPCNIFRTKIFAEQYLVKSYNNVGNAYPHMPFAFGMYLKDEVVYVAKEQIVVAQGGQSYSQLDWYQWWMKTCELLQTQPEVRKAYLDQWKDNGYTEDKVGLQSLLLAKNMAKKSPKALEYIDSFIAKYFSVGDKLKLIYYTATMWSSKYELFTKLAIIRNKLMGKAASDRIQ
jgi:glycosyltransferase involved in cell wall biosynthesis